MAKTGKIGIGVFASFRPDKERGVYFDFQFIHPQEQAKLAELAKCSNCPLYERNPSSSALRITCPGLGADVGPLRQASTLDYGLNRPRRFGALQLFRYHALCLRNKVTQITDIDLDNVPRW